jgi:hypothetical protein
MRRFIGFIVVLVILLVGADRVAWVIAQRGAADAIQEQVDLSERPDVKVSGFPFLTQVLGGRYKQVDSTLDNITVQDGLTIDRLDVRLIGVHAHLGDVIHRSISNAPVDSATATATVGYPSINQVAKSNLPQKGLDVQFSQGPNGRLAVAGSYASALFKAKVNGEAKVLVQDGKVVVKLIPESLSELSPAIRARVVQELGGAYELPALPFGFTARSVTVGASGITVAATADSVHL